MKASEETYKRKLTFFMSQHCIHKHFVMNYVHKKGTEAGKDMAEARVKVSRVKNNDNGRDGAQIRVQTSEEFQASP